MVVQFGQQQQEGDAMTRREVEIVGTPSRVSQGPELGSLDNERVPDVQPSIPVAQFHHRPSVSGNAEDDLSGGHACREDLFESFRLLHNDRDTCVLGIVRQEEQAARISFSGPRLSVSGQTQSGRISFSGSENFRRSVDFSELARRSVDCSELHRRSLDISGSEQDHAAADLRDFEAATSKSKGVATYRRLLAYADALDCLLMTLGTIGGIGDGLIQPFSYYITSGLMNTFGQGLNNVSPQEFQHEINKFAVYYVYLALGSFAASCLEVACWMLTSERQVSRLRSMYLRAILRQDDMFFDTSGANSAEVVNSVANDTLAIQDALSEKLGQFIASISHFVGGFAVAFVLVWRLVVVTLPLTPLLIIPGMMFGRHLAKAYARMHKSNLEAATVAEHAISSARTVFSFVGESKTSTTFARSLDATLRLGMNVGFWKGLAMGANGITFAMWGFMTWYGSTLVVKHGVQGGKVVCAGLAFVNAGIALGTALPSLTYFMEGRAAANRILAMVDRVPDIDADDTGGKVLPRLKGKLEFRNVSFVYPSRPDAAILQRFSLRVPAGKTVALVGESGSGKSTIISLLERFYDPLEGQVLVDGLNIKWLQLKWLRTQIGLVSQEPALFATSIRENIMFGKEGASMEEVVAAAKTASAQGFIEALPDAYETQVGEHGVMMSGGQKQRIAIARAVLKNPAILLLDEATSALDAESEQIVQHALDAAAIGRTTLVVAHRLSTIRNADLIAVVRSGKVVELGPHEELLQIEGGAYAALVNLNEAKADHDGDSAGATDAVVVEAGEIARDAAVRRVPSGRDVHVRRSLSKSSTVSPENVEEHPAPSPVAEKTREQQRPAAEPRPPSLRRLLELSKAEWRQAVLGSVGAIMYGLIQPLYAFFLASTVYIFFMADHGKLLRAASRTSGVFVGLGAACCVANLLQHYYFAEMGERLSKRVREKMLSKVLTFEMGWFDRDENSSGAVCSRISSEANVVRSLVGDRISLIVQTVTAIVFACALGLVLTWRLASVMIAVTPLAIMCFYAKKALLQRTYQLTRKAQEAGSQVASEAVTHHRTIAAFALQDKVVGIFEAIQLGPQKQSRKRAIIAGIGLGAASFTVYAIWALDFWWGGELIVRGQLSYTHLLQCFFVLISAGKMIAVAGSMTSDLAKGANSVKAVFDILDRKTEIEPDDEEGLKLERVEGNVELKGVQFRYPTRPDVVIFRNLNLRVAKGKHVAMVGQSGSGKSTIIGLIERFYDPQEGQVLIDGHDLRRLHLRTIRTHIALVSQEPTLFAGTIRENILYGREDATEAEIVEAAKAANAYGFISSLEEGFQTLTGERGVQLSGGQKQRVAIARAIIKNPAILLLDEATSALDAQSEKTVQDALDRIMVGRTSIVVAHRLSTVRNCDTIAVLQAGTILEQGSHEELLSRGEAGAYAALFSLQGHSPNP
ncbi:hypothetical protein Mapa_010484 [Marchantia paleacea]|nr:hypothetical protein Mapa_010484 [Marchantia paleacea]